LSENETLSKIWIFVPFLLTYKYQKDQPHHKIKQFLKDL